MKRTLKLTEETLHDLRVVLDYILCDDDMGSYYDNLLPESPSEASQHIYGRAQRVEEALKGLK